MGLFDGFRKQTPEDQLRKQISNVFEVIVNKAKREAGGDPVMGGIFITMAIGETYEELKKDNRIISLCAQEGLNYLRILDEEREKAISRYLK